MSVASQSCNPINRSKQTGLNTNQTVDPNAVIPVTITPSCARDRHLAYGGRPRNAGRLAENIALDALRRSALETS